MRCREQLAELKARAKKPTRLLAGERQWVTELGEEPTIPPEVSGEER